MKTEANWFLIKFRTRKISFVAVLISIVLPSCGIMYLKLAGEIKNPKLEDAESIKKYCESKNDPYNLLWMPDSRIHFEEISKKFPGLPEVFIYDKNYTVLKNAHGESCNKLLIDFFNDSLKNEYKKINDSSYTYLKQRCRIVDSKNTPQSFDYTVIYCWAKFTPRITKDLFNRFNTIKQSKKYNILFISLNKDWQKGTFDKVPPISAKVKRNGRALDGKD
jgi:hypothetical protein